MLIENAISEWVSNGDILALKRYFKNIIVHSKEKR
jgi:hypothetical protein